MLSAVSQFLSPHQSAISNQPTCCAVYTGLLCQPLYRLTLNPTGKWSLLWYSNSQNCRPAVTEKAQKPGSATYESGEEAPQPEHLKTQMLPPPAPRRGNLTEPGICCLGSAEFSSYYPTSIKISMISRTWKSAKNVEVLKPRSSKHNLCSLSPGSSR